MQEEWDKIHASHEGARYPDTEFVRFMAKHYYATEDRASVKVLEMGCGTGANLWYLAREGFLATGVDGSVVAVVKSAERLKNEGVAAAVVRSDLRNTGFVGGRFDVVADIEAVSINDFSAAQEIYSECLRLLKPGGRLFVKTFSENTLGVKCRRTAYADITGLLRGFTIEMVEMITRRTASGDILQEWVVSAIKEIE